MCTKPTALMFRIMGATTFLTMAAGAGFFGVVGALFGFALGVWFGFVVISPADTLSALKDSVSGLFRRTQDQ